MTKLKPTQQSKTQLCSEVENKEEERSLSSGSSPSPPESPHSSTEASSEDTAFSELPELPEVISLCHRLTPSILDLKKKRLSAAEFMTILARELTPFIHKPSAHKKTAKKKRDKDRTIRRCSICKTDSTPEWRRDPEGLLTLCNACGLKEKKKAKTTATSSAYVSPRFHSTVWTQQFAATSQQSSSTISHQPQSQSQTQVIPRSGPLPPAANVVELSQQSGRSGAAYQTFQLRPSQSNSKSEDSGRTTLFFQSQRQLTAPPPNVPQYPQSYYPVYEYLDDQFGYCPSPIYTPPAETERHVNCPCLRCLPYYNPNH